MGYRELFSVDVKDGFREPTRRGRFVGREPELARLREVLAERSSATVLVAGFRGAGKTSLVEEAISRNGDASKRLVVRIAPPHLGNETEIDGIRSQVLRSLARGLHFVVTDTPRVKKEIRQRVESAYEKTYLTELEQHDLVESAISSTVARREATTVSAKFELAASIKLLVGALGMGIVASLGVGAAALVAERSGTWWGVVAALFVVAVSIASGIGLNRTTDTEESAAEVATRKDSKTQLGKFDLSDETLEFELRTALSMMDDAGYRVTFVIDELDKLGALNGEPASAVQESPVFAIVTSLKNFFTLGSAAYIFITDQDFFKSLAAERTTGTYHLSHTIFTDRIFLGPLHYSQVENLVDISVVNPPDSEDYDRFKNYVCWESNNHAFDALQVVGSFLVDHDGRTVLRPSTSGEVDGVWREGSLPENWLTKAGLQKHVGVAYDDARRTGLGSDLFNQALWESLHLVAQQLLEGQSLVVNDEAYMSAPGSLSEAMSSADEQLVNAACERMLRRLDRHKAVLETSVEIPHPNPTPETDELISASSFELAGSVPYPPSTIADEAILLPVESLLVDAVERLETIMNETEVDLDQAQKMGLRRVRNRVRELRAVGPRSHFRSRSAIAEAIPIASELAQSVAQAAVQQTIEQWASESGYSVADDLTAVRIAPQKWGQWLAKDFGPLAEAIGEEEADVMLVASPGNDYSVAIVSLATDQQAQQLQTAYSRCLNESSNSREERRQRLPIVLVGLDTDDSVAVPEEIVSVIKEVRPKGWIERLFSRPSAKIVEQRQDLQGWTHFALDDKLSNLSGLPGVLDDISFLRSE